MTTHRSDDDAALEDGTQGGMPDLVLSDGKTEEPTVPFVDVTVDNASYEFQVKITLKPLPDRGDDAGHGSVQLF